MKIRVRLFGTLGRDFPDYQPATGFEIEIPENATVGDLLAHLKIAESDRPVVAINGRIMKPDDILQSETAVQVFQSVFGG
jgi:sulfur carrier protein ThiS